MSDKSIDINDDDICYLDEIIIEGITTKGVKFRPSDWVDRLCGTLAIFNNQKMSYSPYLRPLVHNDMNCVAIKKSLQDTHYEVFQFIMQFASDNDLIVLDCSKFKQQILKPV